MEKGKILHDTFKKLHAEDGSQYVCFVINKVPFSEEEIAKKINEKNLIPDHNTIISSIGISTFIKQIDKDKLMVDLATGMQNLLKNLSENKNEEDYLRIKFLGSFVLNESETLDINHMQYDVDEETKDE